MACSRIPIGLLVFLATACAFDDSRLANFPIDAIDLDLGNGDADLEPPDLVENDPTGPDQALELGFDLREDTPGDAQPDPDLAEEPDLSQDPDAVEDSDASDVPLQDADVDTGVDIPPNQAPVITVPGAQRTPEAVQLELTGISVADPDAGEGPLTLTLSVSEGTLSLGDVPVGLSFTTGDGTQDAEMVCTGTFADINTALSQVIYDGGDYVGEATVSVRVDDNGNTGSGGNRFDEASVLITVERQYDFRVQRGYAVFADGQDTLTLQAGVDYEAPDGPALFRLVNTRLTGMGRTASGGNQNSDDVTAWVDDASELTTSATLGRFGSSNDDRVAWELVEYSGAADGPNALAVHATGIVTFAEDGLTVATAEPVTVGDDSLVVVFITGQATPDTVRGDSNTGLATSSWDDANDLAVFERGEAGGDAAVVSYAIVEFSGANWRVDRVEHTYSAAGVVESESIAAVGDLGRAFLHVQHRAGDGLAGVDELGSEVWLSAVDEVSFVVQNSADSPDSIASVAWIVENLQTGPDAMLVQHIGGTRGIGADEEVVWTEAINAVSSLDRTSILGECGRSGGAGTAFPRGYITLLLLDVEAVELRESDSGQPQSYRFSVVEWPDDP